MTEEIKNPNLKRLPDTVASGEHDRNAMLKNGFRYLNAVYAALLGLLSTLVVGTVMQLAKNYDALAGMKDCVQAVREFETHNSRPPTIVDYRFSFSFPSPLGQP